MRRVHTATHCNTLQHKATHHNTLQHTAVYCNTPQRTASHCNTPQHTATHRNTLQHTATHCNTLQHTATHCNTPQHTAIHCNTLSELEQVTYHRAIAVPTENDTTPKSTESRNSNSSVQIQITPKSPFAFAPRDTEKSEFSFDGLWGCSNFSGNCHARFPSSNNDLPHQMTIYYIK